MRHAVSEIFQGRRFTPASLLCLFLLTAISAAGDVIVGLPADVNGNCFPFGCAYSGEYQQVYSSSQFTGPITITDLKFYNTADNSGASEMNSGNWVISLSTTAADWNTLSSTYADNIGSGNTQVFSGDLFQTWAFGDTLHISLLTPFTYNPASGNLLMDVFASGTSAPGGGIFFDTNGYNGGGRNGNTYLGRVYYGAVDSGYGLVTGFSGTAAVPEPSSVALLGLFMAGVGLAYRRLCR